MGVSKANLNCSMIATHVDVVAHGDGSSRGMDVLIALGGDVCVARCCAHKQLSQRGVSEGVSSTVVSWLLEKSSRQGSVIRIGRKTKQSDVRRRSRAS